jgi:hypothetical protein
VPGPPRWCRPSRTAHLDLLSSLGGRDSQHLPRPAPLPCGAPVLKAFVGPFDDFHGQDTRRPRELYCSLCAPAHAEIRDRSVIPPLRGRRRSTLFIGCRPGLKARSAASRSTGPHGSPGLGGLDGSLVAGYAGGNRTPPAGLRYDPVSAGLIRDSHHRA